MNDKPEFPLGRFEPFEVYFTDKDMLKDQKFYEGYELVWARTFDEASKKIIGVANVKKLSKKPLFSDGSWHIFYSAIEPSDGSEIIMMIVLPNFEDRDYYIGKSKEELLSDKFSNLPEVGEIFNRRFSTTSPPAWVNDQYLITRKENDKKYGRLLDSSVRDMTIDEV